MVKALDPRVKLEVIPALQRDIMLINDLRALFELYQYFRTFRPHIVHTHTSKAGIVGRLAGQLAGVKVLVHGVHILPFISVSRWKRTVYLVLERLAGRFTDAFIHVGQGVREEFRRQHIGLRAIHTVAESGMDIERYRSGQPPPDVHALVRSPIDSPEPPVILLILAALDKRKGQMAFLDVFKQIVVRRANVVLLMAGDGADRAAIESRVKQLGLEKHVKLLGFRDDAEALLVIADLLVVCSEREGLPRSAVQAAIAGVPIVSNALPGVESIVAQGQTGIIVPDSNPSSMEHALVELIDAPEKRRAMNKALRQRDFSAWEKGAMCKKIEIVYNKLISTHAVN